MDLSKILAQFRKEREQIEEAIRSLERMPKGKGRSLRKRSDDPDKSGGGTSGEGCAGVPNPLLPRRPPISMPD